MQIKPAFNRFFPVVTALGVALGVVLGVAMSVTTCTSSQSTQSGGDGGVVGDDVLVLTNAVVYTVHEAAPMAEAIAINTQTGIILAVGSEASVLERAGSEAQVWDLEGRMVLPGFHDPHLHIPEAGVELCGLPPDETQETYADLVRDCAAGQPGTGWVRAAGASISELSSETLFPFEALDEAVPDRPVLVIDDVGHSVWTNSLGLEAAGISDDEPDPPGGVFDRDPDTGQLTGILLENAQHRVRDAAAFSDEVIYQGLLTALDELPPHGITSVSDAGGYWTRNHTKAWQRARDEEELPVRAHNTLYVFPDRPFEQQMRELEQRFSNDTESDLKFNTAKIYVDGILALGTAGLIEPYMGSFADDSSANGFFYFDQDVLERYSLALHNAGFQINFHAIGDGAVRSALDAVEALYDTNPDADARLHRITHTYLVHPEDVPRFASLGVVADFQMAPGSISQENIANATEFLGAERANRIIPVAELLASGAHVTLSSDWDADPLSPLGNIERGLLRSSQAIPDLATAIRLVTLDGARLFHQDDRVGSLEVGKEADLVVLSENLFDIETDQISEVEVVLTFLRGEEIYRKQGFRGEDP